MTKKEYFMNNSPYAALSISAFAYYVLYGIEYGINDFAYVEYVVDGKIQSCHRLMVHYTAGGKAYINVHGSRLRLDEFCRI